MEERLRKHSSNHKGFTGYVGDWKVVRVKLFETKEEAYKREREVKDWRNRSKIEAYKIIQRFRAFRFRSKGRRSICQLSLKRRYLRDILFLLFDCKSISIYYLRFKMIKFY